MKFKSSCDTNISEVDYYPWMVFAITAIGTFMATLDASIVNIALPKISTQLSISPSIAGWIVTSYLLVVSSLLLFFGKIGDVCDRRHLYSSGFLVFVLGSAFCSLSGNIMFLIISRVIQAIGAAVLMANSPAIIADIFSNEKRGRALGLAGSVVALGTMTGPTLGGLLMGKFGWQSIFFINVPIGIVAFILGLMILPCKPPKKQDGYDLTGSVLFIIGIFSFLLFLSQGQNFGWNSVLSLVLLVISIVFFLLFWLNEQKVKSPMIDFSLFKNNNFLFGNLAAMCSFISIFSNIILLPFYLDRILNLSPFKMGLLITPFPIALALIAPISGYFSEKRSKKILTSVGLFVTMIGLLSFITVSKNTAWLQIAMGQFIVGLGNGIFQSPNNNSIISSVHPSRFGIASGISALVRNLGMIAGVAISLSIFESLSHILMKTDSLTSAFLVSYHVSISVGAVFAGLGVILCLKKDDKRKIFFN